jgi:hypothetical protein
MNGGHTGINWHEHYLPEFAQLLFRDDVSASLNSPEPRRPGAAESRPAVTLSLAQARF